MATKTTKKEVTETKKSPFKVTAKVTKENPFYGKRATLDLLQQVSKMTDNVNRASVFTYLDKAWAESTTKVGREMFYTILFSLGDVTNREHNVFVKTFGKGKVEGGGNSLRRVFLYSLEWMLDRDPEQFYRFLPIIGEYTNLENSFFYQLRTDRKTGKIKEIISIVPKDSKKRAEFIEKVASFFTEMIRDVKTSPLQHQLLAKFIQKPRFSKRTRLVKKKNGEMVKKRYSMQKETLEKENFEKDFAAVLSKKLGWEVVEYPNNTRFIGLENYKKKHNVLSEAHLFSSKKILGMDQDQFFKWLDMLPSGARFRVQRKLIEVKEGVMCSRKKWVSKYGDYAEMYMLWLKQKEKANQVVKELEVKKQTKGALSEDEQELLVKATKAAKVNTGGETVLDNIADVFSKSQTKTEFNAKMDNIMRKVDVKVPVMVCADVSGSMTMNRVSHKGVGFYPRDMARIVATMFLLKNPEPDLQNVLVTFSSGDAQILTKEGTGKAGGSNRFMAGHTTNVGELVDPTKSFLDNYESVSRFVGANGGTDLTTIPTAMKRWVDESPGESEMRKEIINRYPVWLVVSDGDINSSSNATASVQDFMMKMKMWFGWNGVLVIWDVKDPVQHATGREEKNKFDNLENVVYYGSCNPQVVTQLFSNIDDLDVIDIYQMLLSLYRSNRYELVKNLVK